MKTVACGPSAYRAPACPLHLNHGSAFVAGTAAAGWLAARAVGRVAPRLARLVAAPEPARQDRLAILAPLAAVLLFLAAIVTAFWYLQVEEMDREQEAVKRDVEYAQQRLRLRLLERQEQLMRLARDVSNQDVDPQEFTARAESLEAQYPELLAVTWINARRRIVASQSAPSVPTTQQRIPGQILRVGDTENSYSLARELQQPAYADR